MHYNTNFQKSINFMNTYCAYRVRKYNAMCTLIEK